MKPGIRVVRGPDWCQGDKDGGPGYLGTVVKINPDNNSALVRWDIGTETVCRAGPDGAFDLRLYDNAQIGTNQYRWFCDGECWSDKTGREPKDNETIKGFKWKCLVCKDTDFCTDCYMSVMKGSEKPCADSNHPFVRFSTPRSLVVRVPLRNGSEKIPLYGIFPGAKVTKIDSPSSENEQLGIVKELIDFQPDAYRNAVKVEWEGATQKKTDDGKPDWPIYRIGADGKVELKLVTPASPGTVYIDHLPVLDLTMPVDVEFNEGDSVRVDLNLDTYKPLLLYYGGWFPDLETVLGELGTVTEVMDTSGRIVSVRYKSLGITVRAMYMNVLTKVTEYLGPADGKTVLIRYQDNDSGLKPPVVKEQRKKPSTEEEKMEVLFEMIKSGETDKVNGIIQKEPQLMFVKLQGKSAVHLACENGQIDILKAMFKCASKDTIIEICDTAEGMTPLLAAVIGEQIDIVKFLVSEGADKTAVNHNKQGAVQMAVARQNVTMLKVLRDHEFDVNQEDILKQSPVVAAIVQGNEEIMNIILEWPDLDIHYTDSIGFSTFFLACRKGNLKAVQKILQERIMGIKERNKQDGYSGLHLVAFNGHKDVVEFLIRQPLVEIDSLAYKDRTPLHLACAEGLFEVVTILVDGGANITLCDASRKNCLHIYLEGAGAKETGQVAEFTRMIEYLIDHDVSVEGLDETEKCPAQYVTDRMKETYQSIVEKKFKMEPARKKQKMK